MQTNKLIWVVSGVFIVLLVMIGIGMSSGTQTTTTSAVITDPKTPPANIEGDTPQDTLKTLLIKIEEMETQLQAQEADRKNSPAAQSLPRTEHETRRRVAELERQLARLQHTDNGRDQSNERSSDQTRTDGSSRSPSNKIPDDFGFGAATEGIARVFSFVESNFATQGKDGRSATSTDGYLDVLPLHTSNPSAGLDGSASKGQNKNQLPGELDSLIGDFNDTRGSFQQRNLRSGSRAIEPRYTIPMNSTLYEATAMTALIGRVPVNGGVTDAFPLKIILGAENLAANGHRIPGLSGMIFSGVATGDWNLSCVSAQIHSATYIWDDGRIQTLTDDTLNDQFQGGRSRNNEESNGGQSIGWISSRSGIPCVPGKRITDAGTASALQVGLALGEGYAQALAQAEVTNTFTDSGNSVSSVTGNSNNYYNNIAISNALGEVSSIISARWKDTFDAIFIEPGRTVSVHITRTLPVDYDPNARKLAYAGTQATSTGPLD